PREPGIRRSQQACAGWPEDRAVRRDERRTCRAERADLLPRVAAVHGAIHTYVSAWCAVRGNEKRAGVDDDRIGRGFLFGGNIAADVLPRLAAIGRQEQRLRTLVSTSQERLTFRVGEVDAHGVVVPRVAQAMEGFPVVGRLVDARPVVDSRFPERA